MIELKKNQLVLFENGYKAKNTEICWSNKHNAFCLVTDEEDENGNRIRFYSTTVIDKPTKEKCSFVPSKSNCSVLIHPDFETEKAYGFYAGDNGHTKHVKYYYDYISKSICFIDENGNIFAPVFAIKNKHIH